MTCARRTNRGPSHLRPPRPPHPPRPSVSRPRLPRFRYRPLHLPSRSPSVSPHRRAPSRPRQPALLRRARHTARAATAAAVHHAPAPSPPRPHRCPSRHPSPCRHLRRCCLLLKLSLCAHSRDRLPHPGLPAQYCHRCWCQPWLSPARVTPCAQVGCKLMELAAAELVAAAWRQCLAQVPRRRGATLLPAGDRRVLQLWEAWAPGGKPLRLWLRRCWRRHSRLVRQQRLAHRPRPRLVKVRRCGRVRRSRGTCERTDFARPRSLITRESVKGASEFEVRDPSVSSRGERALASSASLTRAVTFRSPPMRSRATEGSDVTRALTAKRDGSEHTSQRWLRRAHHALVLFGYAGRPGALHTARSHSHGGWGQIDLLTREGGFIPQAPPDKPGGWAGLIEASRALRYLPQSMSDRHHGRWRGFETGFPHSFPASPLPPDVPRRRASSLRPHSGAASPAAVSVTAAAIAAAESAIIAAFDALDTGGGVGGGSTAGTSNGLVGLFPSSRLVAASVPARHAAATRLLGSGASGSLSPSLYALHAIDDAVRARLTHRGAALAGGGASTSDSTGELDEAAGASGGASADDALWSNDTTAAAASADCASMVAQPHLWLCARSGAWTPPLLHGSCACSPGTSAVATEGGTPPAPAVATSSGRPLPLAGALAATGIPAGRAAFASGSARGLTTQALIPQPRSALVAEGRGDEGSVPAGAVRAVAPVAAAGWGDGDGGPEDAFVEDDEETTEALLGGSDASDDEGAEGDPDDDEGVWQARREAVGGREGEGDTEGQSGHHPGN